MFVENFREKFTQIRKQSETTLSRTLSLTRLSSAIVKTVQQVYNKQNLPRVVPYRRATVTRLVRVTSVQRGVFRFATTSISFRFSSSPFPPSPFFAARSCAANHTITYTTSIALQCAAAVRRRHAFFFSSFWEKIMIEHFLGCSNFVFSLRPFSWPSFSRSSRALCARGSRFVVLFRRFPELSALYPYASSNASPSTVSFAYHPLRIVLPGAPYEKIWHPPRCTLG